MGINELYSKCSFSGNGECELKTRRKVPIVYFLDLQTLRQPCAERSMLSAFQSPFQNLQHKPGSRQFPKTNEQRNDCRPPWRDAAVTAASFKWNLHFAFSCALMYRINNPGNRGTLGESCKICLSLSAKTFINTNVNYHSIHLISMHGYHGSKQWGATGFGGVTLCEHFIQLARHLLAFPPSTSTLCFVTTERRGERRKSGWQPTCNDASGEGCRLTGAAARRQWAFNANVKRKTFAGNGTG